MLITNASKLPNIKNAKYIAYDLETHDPQLLSLGPGSRRDGRTLGIALAVDRRHSWYVNMNSTAGPSVSPEKAWRWLQDTFAANEQAIVIGAALDYDLDYAYMNGVPLPRHVADVLHAGKLLEMQRQYPNLDYLLNKYLDEAKTGDKLWKWLAKNLGGEPTRKSQIGRLWHAPAELVAEYALGDVEPLPELYDILVDRLTEIENYEWFRVESKLLPIFVRMRCHGVRIDEKKIERVQEETDENYARQLEEFGLEAYGDRWKKATGEEKIDLLNANSSMNLARIYERHGIKVPVTDLGNPSITKAWLTEQDDVVSRHIRRLRAMGKLNGTFIEGLLKHVINGRVHPTVKQLFPVTLRTSSENPNEQNQPNPKRQSDPESEELAKLIRSFWLPEPGELWGRHDYDQQEYRLLVHFAQGRGAEEAREAYRKDPTLSFHRMVHSWLPMVSSYNIVKNANFAKAYRSGKDRFAQTLGVTREEGDEVFALYDERLPFVSHTAALAEKTARNREGHYLNLLLKGYRAYFDRWAVDDWDIKNKAGWKHKIFIETFDTKEEAREAALAFCEEQGIMKRNPRISRADLYKALNKVIQGSGAQLIKNAMVNAVDAGIEDHLTLLLMVHDELDCSVPDTKEGRQAFAELARHMREADEGQMSVPLLVGSDVGINWGEVETINLEEWVSGKAKVSKPIKKKKKRLKI